MANYTLTDQPYVVLATSTQKELALDPDRVYSAYHLGVDGSNAESTEHVYFETLGATVTATVAAAEGKLVLKNDRAVPIPEKKTTVYMKTASGSVSVQMVSSKRVP